MPKDPTIVMIEGRRCLQCEYKWVPRGEGRPALCPKCKSLRWDKPKREPK